MIMQFKKFSAIVSHFHEKQVDEFPDSRGARRLEISEVEKGLAVIEYAVKVVERVDERNVALDTEQVFLVLFELTLVVPESFQ